MMKNTSVRAPALALDLSARLAAIDDVALDAGRLQRLRAELIQRDYAAALLSDPMNIRYATGSRNMAIWTMHAPGRYAFVPAEGPVILFECGGSLHLSEGLGNVDELRTGVSAFYFIAGPRMPEKVELWAGQITDLMHKVGGKNRRLAVDRCEPWNARLLQTAGLELFDAQEPLERARAIKTPEELQCMFLSMDVCDIGVSRMRQALQPGITENQLWAILHETNIAHGGEWIECRLLASGPRTNPWYNECSHRVIGEGDLVAFDTDMVGPCGYLSDISRAFVCPGRRPTDRQRMLYDMAQQQVLSNIDLLKPGLDFREFAEKCWPVPPQFQDNRYMMTVHGAGMVDEYPNIPYASDWASGGFDGIVEENMVLCVESYIGETGGEEGVKLEQQVLVTSSGAVPMSKSPFVDALWL